jgi:hypothetical protein
LCDSAWAVVRVTAKVRDRTDRGLVRGRSVVMTRVVLARGASLVLARSAEALTRDGDDGCEGYPEREYKRSQADNHGLSISRVTHTPELTT